MRLIWICEWGVVVRHAILLSLFALLLSNSATASTFSVAGQISGYESYGAQISFFLGGATIPANACGNVDRFAISPVGSDDVTYRAQLGALLAAFAAGNTVTLRVSDANCTGDRVRITYFYVQQ